MKRGDAGTPATAPSGRSLWLATLAVFLLALAIFGALYSRSPLLYDNDSYYHLAVARAQAEDGLDHDFPWIRAGLLARGFGDKEILFHLYLAPLVSLFGPLAGGRIGLALLDALLLAVVGWLAMRAVGWWGLALPFWMLFTSMELFWRMVRLRPELASLLILLLALWAASQRRYRTVGLLAALYHLSYVAIHAFVGLFAILFVVLGWVERKWEWPLLVYPALGAGVALLVHPHFPHNMVIWWFVAVEFFRFKEVLDVGTEIRANLTSVTLLANVGWWLGLAALWRSTESTGDSRHRRAALAFGTAAGVFGLLYLLMSRFALYFVPFATLAVLFAIPATGRALAGRTRLPGRGALPLAAAGVICLLVGLPGARQEIGRYLHRNAEGPNGERIADREAFAAALPEDAHVVAPWRQTPVYMLWAPQGRYLNVLDPGLLAVSDPELHRLERGIFDGSEPDVPFVATAELDSEFVAYSLVTGNKQLTARLVEDPRVDIPHYRINGLFRIRPGRNAAFLRDWKVVSKGQAAVDAPAEELATWPDAPRVEGPASAFAGYVDVSSLAGGRECVTLVREIELNESLELEFAPYGRSALWLGFELVANAQADLGAVLGRSIRVQLPARSEAQRLVVRTCPARERPDRAGFYLIVRG